MNIHHATAKKAEENNIDLAIVDLDDRQWAQATVKETGVVTFGINGKEVLKAALLIKMMGGDYPSLAVVYDRDAREYVIEGITEASDTVEIMRTKVAPELVDVLDAVQDWNEENPDQNVDPEAGYVEEKASVVVPAKYKEMYREAGNPNNCGDEFAEFCDGKFIGPDLKFDINSYLIFCAANGVEPTAKLTTMMENANRGWMGRMRMNMGQMMRRKIAAVGQVEYIVNGETKIKKFSTAYLEQLAAKFPKVKPEWK